MQDFVDFDPEDLTGGLEEVAAQWPTMASWDSVSYRGALLCSLFMHCVFIPIYALFVC